MIFRRLPAYVARCQPDGKLLFGLTERVKRKWVNGWSTLFAFVLVKEKAWALTRGPSLGESYIETLWFGVDIMEMHTSNGEIKSQSYVMI